MKEKALADLIPLAQAGNPEALSALMEHVRACFRRNPFPDHDSEQDTYVAVLQGLRNGFAYRSRREFVSWLNELRNSALYQRRRRSEAQKRGKGRQALPEALLEVPTSQPGPVEVVHVRFQTKDLEHEISTLPSLLHHVLLARDYRGLTFDAIAAELDITEVKARRGYAEALRRLALALRPPGSE